MPKGEQEFGTRANGTDDNPTGNSHVALVWVVKPYNGISRPSFWAARLIHFVRQQLWLVVLLIGYVSA